MALSGQLTVNSEQLRTQAGVVRSELSQMKGRFDTLKSAVTGTSAYWTGDASDVHRQLYTDKIEHIEEMFLHYEEHIRDLETMAGVYEQAETQAGNAADTLPASSLD